MIPSAQDMARDFAALGATHAFGIPGGGPSLDWVDAFGKSGGTFITTGHEATGAFMAGAFGRLGGKAAAVSIKGPGFANLFPGLLSNRYEGYPMLVFSEAYPSGDASGRRHKWLDQRTTTPWLRHVLPTGGPVVARAWETARKESPSPVLLELSATPSMTGEVSGGKAPGTAAVDFSLLKSASRPVLIVGSCALRRSWGKVLALLHVPVFTTPAAKGVIDESLAHAAGIYTGDGKAVTVEASLLPQADVVVLLGVRAGEVLSPKWPGAACLDLECDGTEATEVFPDNSLDTNSARLDDAGVAELFRLLGERSWGSVELAEARKKQRGALDATGTAWGRVFAETAALAPGATHVLDTGNFTVLAEHFLPAAAPHSVIGTPNGRFMGAGIGHALGAAFARPGQPVILWIGDGGIRSYFSELALAAEHRLPLLVVCLRDGYFGSILGRARSAGLTDGPLVMQERHLVDASAKLGLASSRLDGLEALPSFVREWLRAPASAFAEVPIESATYLSTTALFR